MKNEIVDEKSPAPVPLRFVDGWQYQSLAYPLTDMLLVRHFYSWYVYRHCLLVVSFASLVVNSRKRKMKSRNGGICGYLPNIPKCRSEKCPK